jgi:hypothetical protein
MQKAILSAIVGFALACGSAWAADEVVAKDSKPFPVKYNNGTAEKYIAEWSATVSVDKSESGGPAEPLKGKLIDDRKCQWTIITTVVRRLYLTNPAGELFEKKDLATPPAVKFANQGADFKLLQLRPESCGDTNARFESDVKDARNAVKTQLPGIMNSDAAIVKTTLKGWPNVTDVQ